MIPPVVRGGVIWQVEAVQAKVAEGWACIRIGIGNGTPAQAPAIGSTPTPVDMAQVLLCCCCPSGSHRTVAALRNSFHAMMNHAILRFIAAFFHMSACFIASSTLVQQWWPFCGSCSCLTPELFQFFAACEACVFACCGGRCWLTMVQYRIDV